MEKETAKHSEKNKDYRKIKESYQKYLATFKLLNHGSLDGATSFEGFYCFMVFKMKYKDSRRSFINK